MHVCMSMVVLNIDFSILKISSKVCCADICEPAFHAVHNNKTTANQVPLKSIIQPTSGCMRKVLTYIVASSVLIKL